MTMMDGRQVSLWISNGATPEVMLALGGLTESEAEWLARPAALTAVSSNGWAHSLSGSGPRSLVLRGEGVFEASAGEARLLLAAQSAAHTRFRLQFSSVQTVEGLFVVTRYVRTATRDGVVQTRLTLESAGPMVVS
ncbi:MAG: phage tail protein [Rickettsiales bacterium]|nr:phage tail protein [Rickettsiales bacterium]